MTVYPVKFEAVDDVGDFVFTVEAFDDKCATIEIKTVVSSASWDGISSAIKDCLIQMENEDAR